MITVEEAGVVGDYNHYQTVALKSTVDRAISILTNDVSTYIKSLEGGSFSNRYREGEKNCPLSLFMNLNFFNLVGAKSSTLALGDLGENILIEGVDFSFFRVGGRYRFTSKNDAGSSGESKAILNEVIVEITEPMEPCANLCKLPYINDPSLISARDRVMRCKYFIDVLGRKDGLRGWYAKVIRGGMIKVGDSISDVVAMTIM
jgi:hypothetical protein